MTLADAKRYRATFFKKYPEFRAWHKKVSTACTRSKGFATTPLGRRRKLPKWASKAGVRQSSGAVAFTAAVNHPVQGAGADAMKLTLAKIFERRLEAPGASCGAVRMCATVHDEVILSAPEEAGEELRSWVGAIMAEAEREAVIDPKSPIAVDVAVTSSWGES
jgi:DNA polymerase-1